MTPSQRDDSLGYRLRAARAAAGLSQSMLERKSGIPKSMLSRYENDHLLPSVRTLRRLAEAIGIGAATFFEDEASPAMLDRELAHRGVRFGSRAEMLRYADMICDALAQQEKQRVRTEPTIVIR
ncbi:MAG: helix-turn-helix transcriptional regulator [Actinomycetota bacterium]